MLLLAGDATITSEPTTTSTAQLPLLLAQKVGPTLLLGRIQAATLYGINLSTTAPSTTTAQLPLLLAQRPKLTDTLTLGHISAATLYGVNLGGSSSVALTLKNITANATVRGVNLAPSGFLAVGPSCPSIMVEIDLNDPTDPDRAWRDVTAYVRDVQITRGGRDHELRRSEVGTCQVVVSNRDGRFDPANDTSPYWPNLKRLRWLRVRGLYGNNVYPRCQMLIESIDQDWPGVGMDAQAVIRCADPLKILGLYDLEGETFPAETTGDRIARLLDLADVTSSSVASGHSSCVDVGDPLAEGTIALEHARAVEETENGQLFCDGAGLVVFQDRHLRALNKTATGTVGDSPGEIPYRAAMLAYDDAAVANSIRVTTATGTAVEREDAASIQSYYRRRLTRQLLTDDENDAANTAEYLLGLYADPPTRLPRITLLGQADPTQWPTILNLENGTLLRWRRRPSTEGASRTIEKRVIVERISETIEPKTSWETTIDVSPADLWDYWILGDATYGILDQTTRAGY
jgi:hypothetical protein